MRATALLLAALALGGCLQAPPASDPAVLAAVHDGTEGVHAAVAAGALALAGDEPEGAAARADDAAATLVGVSAALAEGKERLLPHDRRAAHDALRGASAAAEALALSVEAVRAAEAVPADLAAAGDARARHAALARGEAALALAARAAAAWATAPGGEEARGAVRAVEDARAEAAAALDVKRAWGARFPVAPTAPVPVSAPTAEFLDGFDVDGDGGIDLAEALDFFAAVERRVAYRYDDEDASGAVRGLAVGDGRPGRDHAQTPDETLAEGFGDCEDSSLLEAAFYRRFGVPAVLGFVNLTKKDGFDHAVLLVPAPAPVADVERTVGRVRTYALDREPAGAWVVVDHTNADRWGETRRGGYALFELRDVDLARLDRFATGERPRLL